ncbi:hypothetical protein EYF80_035944 [Liparis tanakae]|uniref:Uncharacterized protein n=1 Tax=Liparis tanakae TaxID=230148 RepID=A0A4Z2GM51_9TELE|nr:hypothetical protein EYF80_035944 [Liparis tanakae]
MYLPIQRGLTLVPHKGTTVRSTLNRNHNSRLCNVFGLQNARLDCVAKPKSLGLDDDDAFLVAMAANEYPWCQAEMGSDCRQKDTDLDPVIDFFGPERMLVYMMDVKLKMKNCRSSTQQGQTRFSTRLLPSSCRAKGKGQRAKGLSV